MMTVTLSSIPLMLVPSDLQKSRSEQWTLAALMSEDTSAPYRSAWGDVAEDGGLNELVRDGEEVSGPEEEEGLDEKHCEVEEVANEEPEADEPEEAGNLQVSNGWVRLAMSLGRVMDSLIKP